MLDAEPWDQLARECLVHFGLMDAEIEVIKTSNNIIYRVDVPEMHYVLRIHQAGRRQLSWIESELKWLEAIRRDADLRVPQPAAPIYQTMVGEKPIYSTLLHWLDGEQVLPSALTLAKAQKIGVFAAQLHEHSASIVPTSSFVLPHLDWKDMFGTTSPYYSVEGAALFSREQHEVMTKVAERVREVTSILDGKPDQFGVIHADLIWKNILFVGNTVGVIDFDDCAYSYYLYDLAPALLGYLDEPNYTQIRAAIWQGYTSMRPLPDTYGDYVETFVAARYALSCWWIAANRNNPAIGERAPEIIAYRIGELRRYLETGNLRRGEIII